MPRRFDGPARQVPSIRLWRRRREGLKLQAGPTSRLYWWRRQKRQRSGAPLPATASLLLARFLCGGRRRWGRRNRGLVERHHCGLHGCALDLGDAGFAVAGSECRFTDLAEPDALELAI